MPEILAEEHVPNETLGDEVPPINVNERVGPEVFPEDIQQPKPMVKPEDTFRKSIDDTTLNVNYFNDLSRVHTVGVADETNRVGVDQLNGMDAVGKAQLYQAQAMMGQGEAYKEVLGTVEMLTKGVINMFGDGFNSTASMWRAFTEAPDYVLGLDGTFKYIPAPEGRTFGERYISAQGAIAAANGRFYDYTPLLETTSHQQEAVAAFMKGTVGASSEYLGRNTFELTGSPELAAAASLIPDATLMALPFLPKGLRALRNSQRLAEFNTQLDDALQTSAQRENLTVQHIDEVPPMDPLNPDGAGDPGSMIRVFSNDNGKLVGEQIARRRGNDLQVTGTLLDKSLRGKGVGRQMYETTMDKAAAAGYDNVVSDTQLSQDAMNVFDTIRRNGKYRVEKLDPRDITTEVDEQGVTQHTSNNGKPIFKVILDEPRATSTLETTKMKVETLDALRRGAPPPDPALVDQLAQDLAAGKAAGDIIVETVEGVPTRILSGAENMDGLVAAAKKAGLNIRNVSVKMQERSNVTPEQLGDLVTQAKAGMKDITENQMKLDAAEANNSRSLWQKLEHLFVDTNGNVKAQILRTFGAAGEEAIKDFSLKAGAVPKAHMMFLDFHRAVFGSRGPTDPGIGTSKGIRHLDTTVSERELFNILVQSRRTAAIVKSGGARAAEGRFQLAGAVKPENAAGNIWAVRQTVGEARFAQLQARADTVFDTMHTQLVRLRENGLITEGQFRKMQNIDYIRREFLEQVDPIMLQSQLKGSKVSIGESGIYHLKGGSGRAQNIDVQSLVAEYLARTEGRIFRNNANKTLFRLAENDENSFVRIPKTESTRTPEGYTELKVMIDGKPQRMFMKDLYAQEWVVNDPGLNMTLANIFKIVNGTFIVKPLATGINPAFALVNFPRDIMHAWKATGNEYSAFLPRYLGQIFHDIWEVKGDVWNKEGAYRDFVNEGGGMNFLTHGGFDPLTGFSRAKDIQRAVGVYDGAFGRNWSTIKEALSKVNEFSELAVRLGIRNRVLKNQAARGEIPNPSQATFIARDYLDFSQGGSATKAIESFLPYTNAAAQAIRTSVRQYGKGIRDARVAALKDLQIVSMKAIQSGWAWMEHPEVMAQVDPHQAMTSQVYPTGLSYVDEHGNRRHLTIQIAMDTTAVPYTAAFDLAIAKHALAATGLDPNYIPDRHTLEEIAAVVPILGSIRTGTPIFQAAAALWGNKDIWANKDIWTGDPYVLPGARRTGSTEGTIFDELGSVAPTYVSPVQLQKAWRTYVPSNFYIDSADFIRQMVQQSTDPVQHAESIQRDKDDLTLEILAKVPGLSRVIHLTHPAAQTTPELKTLAQEVQTWKELERQAVDKAVRKYRATGDSSEFGKLLEQVASARPQDADKAKDMLITQIAVGEMYKLNKYDIGFVGQDWFNNIAGQNPETRADLFYWKWVTLGNENARNLEAVLGSIDKVAGRRIRTEEFETQFKRNIAQFGTREQRTRAIAGSN
jgi:predicted GNAT family acetyltransferase